MHDIHSQEARVWPTSPRCLRFTLFKVSRSSYAKRRVSPMYIWILIAYCIPFLDEELLKTTCIRVPGQLDNRCWTVWYPATFNWQAIHVYMKLSAQTSKPHPRGLCYKYFLTVSLGICVRKRSDTNYHVIMLRFVVMLPTGLVPVHRTPGPTGLWGYHMRHMQCSLLCSRNHCW